MESLAALFDKRLAQDIHPALHFDQAFVSMMKSHLASTAHDQNNEHPKLVRGNASF